MTQSGLREFAIHPVIARWSTSSSRLARLSWQLPKNAAYSGAGNHVESRAAMSIAIEEKRIRSLLDRVETVEDVARTLPEGDERRARLLEVSNAALAEEGTIRPVIAARLLGLSEKTIRAWAAQGVIAVAQPAPDSCWTCKACFTAGLAPGPRPAALRGRRTSAEGRCRRGVAVSPRRRRSAP